MIYQLGKAMARMMIQMKLDIHLWVQVIKKTPVTTTMVSDTKTLSSILHRPGAEDFHRWFVKSLIYNMQCIYIIILLYYIILYYIYVQKNIFEHHKILILLKLFICIKPAFWILGFSPTTHWDADEGATCWSHTATPDERIADIVDLQRL